MRKYVPKKITETEIQKIRFSVSRAAIRLGTMSPGIFPHFKQALRLATEEGGDAAAAQQILNEMSLIVLRGGTVKLSDPRIKRVFDTALDHDDQDFIHKVSKALKSPAEIHITPTEHFLLWGWARGSFSFADNGSFPPLVLFTVKDLTRLIQAVLETRGVTESSLEAIIGRKLKLQSIKHSKVTTAQASRWIQNFQSYKADHSAQVTDRFEMWDLFLKEQEFINACSIRVGISPMQAKTILKFCRNNREEIRRHFRGKHSDTGGK